MKKRLDKNFLLRKPSTLSEKFHAKTKLTKLGNQINEKFWPEEWKTIHYKGYSRLDEIILPKPKLSRKISLKMALKKRISGRDFSKEPISLEKIGTLLKFSVGVNIDSRRFYPSAGGRYPLEVYIISQNTEIPKGIYHYYLKNHSLEKLRSLQDFNHKAYFNQPWIAKASVIILISAVFNRNTVKYGDRGYRHVMIEAGHLSQNFYLNSAALNLSCCSIGGFLDDKFNKLLDVDGVEESVVCTLAIGETPA